jgi:hypothetical protein
MNNKLAARVRAVNRANAECMKLYDLLSPFFGPLVNSKILKADSQFLAKYEKIMPSFPNAPGITIYRRMSNYSLVWGVSVCEQEGDGHCLYHEVMCYVGELRGDTLTVITPRVTLRTDYTAEEITSLRQAYRAAQTQADNAKSNLGPFGEWDR